MKYVLVRVPGAPLRREFNGQRVEEPYTHDFALTESMKPSDRQDFYYLWFHGADQVAVVEHVPSHKPGRTAGVRSGCLLTLVGRSFSDQGFPGAAAEGKPMLRLVGSNSEIVPAIPRSFGREPA
ncbi:MAG: hypothetical protein L6Q57_05580 [Alphaproteobacteria bacterium]|nr:hypothetical protein [Alphaproteobacteria bacterium]